MTIVLLQISLHRERRVEHLTRIFKMFSDHHEMSLNIDMKRIRPVNLSGVTLNFDSNSWTLVQSSNVVSLGTYSTRILLAHQQFNLSKALYSGELLNHVNMSSHA